jgi:hypothetical protein
MIFLTGVLVERLDDLLTGVLLVERLDDLLTGVLFFFG